MIRQMKEKQITIQELSNSITFLNFKTSFQPRALLCRIVYENRYVTTPSHALKTNCIKPKTQL